MRIVLLLVELLGVYSILTTDTERGIQKRERRGINKNCFSPFNVMTINKEKKDYDINISESFFDRIYRVGNIGDIDLACDDIYDKTRESENEIYVTNHLEERKKREISDKEDQEEEQVERKRRETINTTADNIRMIERLAVKADELQTKIDVATAVLESPEIKEERKKFLLHKGRMKNLIKLQLQTVVQKHMALMEEYERVLIPEQFHR